MPDSAFNNIDYKNKTHAVHRPDKLTDIDVDGKFYSNIIEASDSGILDLNTINSFTSVSQSRDDIYNMIDVMCEDPIISSALNIYTSDACEPNESGQIVWAESDDANIAGMVNHLLDSMSVDKNSYGWVYQLVKYGDLYLHLLRNSEFDGDLFKKEEPQNLNEDVILKAYKKNDHYAEYMEAHKNPAEIFDLQRFGKTAGYIRSHIVGKYTNDDVLQRVNQNNFQYNFNKNDVDLYPATEYVHSCLEDAITRASEEVSIFNGEDGQEYSYKVRRGQSILYNKFRIWRELSLLENSVMLNRITKSAVVRMVQVEVGDMEKSDVRNLLHRIKSMVEQKSAIGVGSTYEDYTNPGPVENTIYVPMHDGKGKIEVSQIGGDTQTDDLKDVNYFKNKLFAGLGIPGDYLGESSTDGSMFNNGNSLSIKSSQYAKTVKKIQNAYLQGLTDAINLILLDKGLNNYINGFRLRMQAPTTQEEKDRKENLTNSINNAREIMSLTELIEDPAARLNILKSLISNFINNQDIISILQEQIEKLEQGQLEVEAEGEEGMEDFGDFGDLGGGDLGGDLGGSQPMELPDEGGADLGGGEPMEEPAAEEPPQENFLINKGSELLNEENSLPSWSDLNMNYTDFHV